MDTRFYVYAHLRKDGTPFYVGKGKDKRIVDRTSRSTWWWNIFKKEYPDEKIPNGIILSNNLTEQEALDIEKYWIALFGRKNIHSNGILINNTDGGEGTVGAILSEETRSKMSKSRKGKKNPMWGKTRTEEEKLIFSLANKGKVSFWRGKTRSEKSRIKMSKAQGSKPTTYKNMYTNEVVFDVINKNDFARKYNLNANHIRAVARGERKSHLGWVKI
jgi:group I intron endonuclease